MNKRIYKELILKKYFKKNINIKTISILVIVSIITMAILSFNNTIDNYINVGIMEDAKYRTFFLDSDINEDNNEIINKISKIEHVTSVVEDTAYSTILDISSVDKSLDGSIILQGTSVNTMSNIIAGRKIENNNEIICPINFFPDENLDNKQININKLINMNDYLGKKINVSFSQILDFETMEKNIVEMNLEIVGIYKNSKNYVDENTCYSSYELIQKIYNESTKNIDLSHQHNSVIVQIDNLNNFDEVYNDISNLGYGLTSIVQLNTDLFNTIDMFAKISIIFFLIIVILFLNYFNKKNFNNKIKEYYILKCIGYEEDDIIKLSYIEGLLTVFISSLISLIIIYILLFFIKVYFNMYPFLLGKVTIFVKNSSIFSILGIITLSTLYTLLSNSKKLKNTNIIESLKD